MINPEPWVTRAHRGPRATPLPLLQEYREAVEAAIRPATAEKRVVLRGMGLLAMADGLSIRDTAKALQSMTGLFDGGADASRMQKIQWLR